MGRRVVGRWRVARAFGGAFLAHLSFPRVSGTVVSPTRKVTKQFGWNTDQNSGAFLIDTLKNGLEDGMCAPESRDLRRTGVVPGERERWGAWRAARTTGW